MRNLLLTTALLTVVVGAPAAGADAAAAIAVPPGYVLQELETTYGAIARPKDWFACSSGTPSGWMWTFSLEDCKGVYETGLRIQLFVGFRKAGFTPEAFAQDFIAKRRAQDTVLSECEAAPMANFQRKCLEVLETITRPASAKNYRIQHSVFWDANDMAVVTTFGTTTDKWDAMRDVANVMSKFVLIGDKFWNNPPAPGSTAQ